MATHVSDLLTLPLALSITPPSQHTQSQKNLRIEMDLSTPESLMPERRALEVQGWLQRQGKQYPLQKQEKQYPFMPSMQPTTMT